MIALRELSKASAGVLLVLLSACSKADGAKAAELEQRLEESETEREALTQRVDDLSRRVAELERARPAKPSRPASPAVSGPLEDREVVLDENLAKSLDDKTSLLRQVRVVPDPDGGLRLYGIRRGSVASRLTLQNGDVLRKLNGKPIGDLDDALALHTELRKAKTVTVELDRRGKRVRISYRVK